MAKLLTSCILPSISVNLVLNIFFFTRLLISGILFSTAVNSEIVAKPLILGILSSTSLILELKSVFLPSH